jgi:2-oxoisovalerate dehydrogenase E1 component
MNSFAQALAGKISETCFEYLDAPVKTYGSVPTPAIPLNSDLEAELLPNAEKVSAVIADILNY